jgi:hypothetical protein
MVAAVCIFTRSAPRHSGRALIWPNSMATDFIINTNQKVVLSFGWDTLTFADIINHRTRLSEDTRFCRDFGQIIDFTCVTEMKLSNYEIRSLAQQQVFAPESRRALVAASKPHYGLGRMFQAYSETQNISIFQGLHDAVAWVGVPVEVANTAFSEFRSTHGLTGTEKDPS